MTKIKVKVAVEFEIDLENVKPNTAEYLYEDMIDTVVDIIIDDVEKRSSKIKSTKRYIYLPEDDENYKNGTLSDS